MLFVIRDYFSFFNYRVIKHIVNGLGTNQDKVELQNYERDFDEFQNVEFMNVHQSMGLRATLSMWIWL